MGNRTRILIIAAVLVIAVVAVGLYAFFGGESGVASEVISAPTLAVNTPVPTTEAAVSTVEASGTEEATAEAAAATSGGVIFNIVPEESQVSFALSETLMGNPTNVVGITDQVAGQLLVDFANPAATQIGTIRINVRTLATDSDMRNRAIRRAILQSDQDQFEFAEFTNIELSDLPASVTIGEPFTFNITGDFTLRTITNRVTFAARVTPVSETELSGTASTVVQRALYELTIPNAPGVANVSEDVTLEISFVARADS
ncbi:MAG: YceI family protein [Anaerolineae bacterium]|nr:YceI family protein [Anaerolineae bacterium]